LKSKKTFGLITVLALVLVLFIIIYGLYNYILIPYLKSKAKPNTTVIIDNKIVDGEVGSMYRAEDVEVGKYEVYAGDPRKYLTNERPWSDAIYVKTLLSLENLDCVETYIKIYQNFNIQARNIKYPCSSKEAGNEKIHSADIIEYTEDSLLVKARIYYRRRPVKESQRMRIVYLYAGLLHPKSDPNTIDITDEDIYKEE